MLLLLSTYSIKDHSFFSSKFNIKKIIIQNNLIIENEIVEKKLSYLYDENILFFNRKDLEIKLKEIDFIESFKIFYFKLNKIKFPIETIKTFYFFDSRRWDIVTISNQLIKLPTENYEKSLKNFLSLKDHNNFYKYKVFDYRIQDQLILK